MGLWWWVIAGVGLTLGASVLAVASLMRRGVGYRFSVLLPDPADPARAVRVDGILKFNHPIGRLLKRVCGRNTITIGTHIFTDDGDLSPDTFVHECRHILQFRRYGWMMVGYYVRPYVFAGTSYAKHWAETEAERYEVLVADAGAMLGAYLREGRLKIWALTPPRRTEWHNHAVTLED